MHDYFGYVLTLLLCLALCAVGHEVDGRRQPENDLARIIGWTAMVAGGIIFAAVFAVLVRKGLLA